MQLSDDFYYPGETRCWGLCVIQWRLLLSTPLCNSVVTSIIKMTLSVESYVQLSADFYDSGETQCWGPCATQCRILSSKWNSVPNFIIKVKLSVEVFVQLRDDFYYQGDTRCWIKCTTQCRFLLNSVLKPLCNSVTTYTVQVKLSVKASVKLRHDFYHQGETQCWSPVQLSDDFYYPGETQCWSLCET